MQERDRFRSTRGGPSIGYAHGANGRATAISDSRSESLSHSHNIHHRLLTTKHLPIFLFFFFLKSRAQADKKGLLGLGFQSGQVEGEMIKAVNR